MPNFGRRVRIIAAAGAACLPDRFLTRSSRDSLFPPISGSWSPIFQRRLSCFHLHFPIPTSAQFFVSAKFSFPRWLSKPYPRIYEYLFVFSFDGRSSSSSLPNPRFETCVLSSVRLTQIYGSAFAPICTVAESTENPFRLTEHVAPSW